MLRRFALALLCRTDFKSVLLCAVFLVAGIGRAEESYFDSGGVQIHYLVEGKGEPVLLIHGFVVNAHLQWGLPGIFKALAKDHRVIALDVRGHGKSGKPSDADKYGTEMVEDAVRLLDHLKIDKAHVVGYSMGALITGKLLVTHPDRLLSATLGGAGVFPEWTRPPPFIEKLADSLEEGKGIGPLLIALTPSGKHKPSEVTIKLINRSVVGDNGKVLAAVVRSWKKLGVSKEQLKANKVPTLALIGAQDPLKESIDLIKDEMANLQVVVIDGKGHLSTYFDPKFVRSLRQFLSEHKSSPTNPSRDRKGAAEQQPLPYGRGSDVIFAE
jgi:pimeloyl-ACP methyl ester carboxylesterase